MSEQNKMVELPAVDRAKEFAALRNGLSSALDGLEEAKRDVAEGQDRLVKAKRAFAAGVASLGVEWVGQLEIPCYFGPASSWLVDFDDDGVLVVGAKKSTSWYVVEKALEVKATGAGHE
ncbi:hypothetical protein [Jeongeupia chitinilytica]|uniref:DUF2203 family protein n=1 Tax=Jeongeupia chitinilytica TaxID=1041641 RepID=A0ABQ3GXC7_9NEIS|nr:hypothetical protein [Jeongeupia chitinilytica]GHD59788.1 hypothetical protein GCM10007350_11540 [Jeongeupia chitinilytica]